MNKTRGEIKEHELVKLEIPKLKIDKLNPNFMTDEQIEGLRESMRQFGFLDPIIVDQNNVIADGEHRVLVYKEFGRKIIDGYRLELSDTKRRLLRQVMNKLRGQHDKKADISELTLLLRETPSELEKILQIREENIKDLERILEATNRNSIYQTDFQDEVPITEIDGTIPTNNKCPKCGYSW